MRRIAEHIRTYVCTYIQSPEYGCMSLREWSSVLQWGHPVLIIVSYFVLRTHMDIKYQSHIIINHYNRVLDNGRRIHRFIELDKVIASVNLIYQLRSDSTSAPLQYIQQMTIPLDSNSSGKPITRRGVFWAPTNCPERRR